MQKVEFDLQQSREPRGDLSHQDAAKKRKAPFVPPKLERHQELPKLTGSKFVFS